MNLCTSSQSLLRYYNNAHFSSTAQMSFGLIILQIYMIYTVLHIKNLFLQALSNLLKGTIIANYIQVCIYFPTLSAKIYELQTLHKYFSNMKNTISKRRILYHCKQSLIRYDWLCCQVLTSDTNQVWLVVLQGFNFSH